MKIRSVILLSSLFVALTPAKSCGIYGAGDLFSDDPVLAERSIQMLRHYGSFGVDVAIRAYRNRKDMSEEEQTRCRAVIDRVAGQKDALWSGLFWHTDFAAALEAAKASGRPILSLRLLGNLDEELSCANSRFFRTVLYPDERVSPYLRENFVLHWKSVRPVPKLTVDFGDGRKLERTITGNSVHYVLDSRGRVIDALPGLYDPAKFLAELQESKAFFDANGDKCSRTYPTALAAWHRDNLTRLESDAAPRPLGENARRIIREKLPAIGANALSASKLPTEAPAIDLFAVKVRNLEESLAEDTRRNETTLHRRVHERLAGSENAASVDDLNAWVYAELFQAPDSDPWLGLLTADRYTGIASDGAVVTAAAPQQAR